MAFRSRRESAACLDAERSRADGLAVKKDFGAVLSRWKSASALKVKFSRRDIPIRHTLPGFSHDLSTVCPADADRSGSAAPRQDGQIDGVLRRENGGELGHGLVRIQRPAELNHRDLKRPRSARGDARAENHGCQTDVEPAHRHQHASRDTAPWILRRNGPHETPWRMYLATADTARSISAIVL
jgi:hypothetical protein